MCLSDVPRKCGGTQDQRSSKLRPAKRYCGGLHSQSLLGQMKVAMKEQNDRMWEL